MTLTTKPCTGLCYQICKQRKVGLAKRIEASILKEGKRLTKFVRTAWDEKVISIHQSHANTRPQNFQNCNDSKNFDPSHPKHVQVFVTKEPGNNQRVRLVNTIEVSVFFSKKNAIVREFVRTTGDKRRDKKEWDQEEGITVRDIWSVGGYGFCCSCFVATFWLMGNENGSEPVMISSITFLS